MAEHWVSTAPYGSAYWAARSPMGANLARMGYWDYSDDAPGIFPPGSSNSTTSTNELPGGVQAAIDAKKVINAAKTGANAANTAANAALTNNINNLDMEGGAHVADLAHTPSANLAGSYLGGGLFNPNIYDTAFSTGTSVGADLANIGDEVAATQAGSTGSLASATPYLRAGAGVLGFGLSAYDLAKNGVSPTNFGGMMSSGLAAASPWASGAGMTSAVIALPVAFASIMKARHKKPPKFVNNIEDITPFKIDEENNVYMKTPGHGEIFRFNPTTNRYQGIRSIQGGEDVGMGGENMSQPTYGGEWVDLPVYEHNGEYYLRPMESDWSDFYNIKPISEYTQSDVRQNETLNDLYNTRMEGFRTKQEADNIWDNRFLQEEGPMGSAVSEVQNPAYQDIYGI